MIKVATKLVMTAACVLLAAVGAYAQANSTGTPINDKSKHVLLVVTSADLLPNGRQTGVWLEEFAAPYQLLKKAGFTITVASPKGGAIPLDPQSLDDSSKAKWSEAMGILKNSVPLHNIKAENFAAIFLPGGHGTMMDFPDNQDLKRLLHDFAVSNAVIAAVCHGPAGFVGAKGAHGEPLVSGKRITSFTDVEETAINLDKVVPFLLESRLRAEGANFIVGTNWASHVETDGNLVTGQNPASSEAVAEEIIKLLK